MINRKKYEELINSKDYQENKAKYTNLQPYYSFLVKENFESLEDVSIDALIKLIGFFKYYNSDFFQMKNIPVNCSNLVNFEMWFNLSGHYKLDVKVEVSSLKQGLIFCLRELSRLSNLYEIKKEDFNNLYFDEFRSLDEQKKLTIKEKILEIKKKYLEYTESTVKYVNRNTSCKINSYKKETISFFKEIYDKILVLN